MTRLEKIYKETVVPKLMKDFGYTNPMQVPKITKITLNMGVGEAAANKKILENATADMAKISGQKPLVTKSRVSVASFKIRDGWPIGCKVTLRRNGMYEFFDRLVNVALPRVRDFRGVSDRSFDGRGNYSLGIREQIIFPEIDLDKVEKVRGLTVTIGTTAPRPSLLESLGTFMTSLPPVQTPPPVPTVEPVSPSPARASSRFSSSSIDMSLSQIARITFSATGSALAAGLVTADAAGAGSTAIGLMATGAIQARGETSEPSAASRAGSPPSCASTQTSVAGASLRQATERTPVGTASLPTGRPSISGSWAMVCRTCPPTSITSMRRGNRVYGTR